MTRFFILLSALLCIALSCAGSEYFDGYTLFNPNGSSTTYLIDMDGEIVHQWNHSRSGGYAVYLLENGHLLRPASDPSAQLRGGASAGYVQEVDWDGNVVWEYKYSSRTYITHHDIEPMPNGNILLIAWEVKSASEALAAGRSRATETWPVHVIEVEPVGATGGNIVWEWHAWDHLIQDNDPTKDNYGVVEDHPELFDVNLGKSSGDWIHINGISYNPDLDQIVLSSHFTDELYVIDHSTTTEEAAGHTGGNSGKGGDILYRWGRPGNYGAPGSTYFDVIHCSWWVPAGMPGAGNIMVFSNGEGSRRSSIVEITPPLDENNQYILTPGAAYGPSAPTWEYENGTSFYSNHLGGCQRLPNGNTLISESTSGYLFEVTPDGEKVWDYDAREEISSRTEIARSLRYAKDYPGLAILNPGPSIAGVSVEWAPVAGGTEINIIGQNFTADTEITVDGTPLVNRTYVSATVITGETPAHSAGSVSVTAANATGSGTLDNAFTYVEAPTLDSATPNMGVGDETITLEGTNFTDVEDMTVLFGGELVTADLTVSGATQLTCRIPACSGVDGWVSIQVNTSGGTATLSEAYACRNGFRRGDANCDNTHDLSDAIFTLIYLFSNGEPNCLDAVDANDDGGLDLADALYLLGYLYDDGPPPPPPFEEAGFDTTADDIDCTAQCGS